MFIIRALTFALIPIIVNGVFAFLRKPEEAEKGKVHLPKFFAILGTISSSIFLVPAIITAFSDGDVWVPVCFLTFSLLGATLIIAFMNCRISYDDDGFVAKTFFGIKRRVSYDQVTAIKENMHETYIYVGKRRVMVDEFSIGGKDFINLVKKKYRTFNNGQSLPKITKTKNDIFNGHVKDVTGVYVAYVLVTVLLVGLVIVSFYDVFIPKNEDNTIIYSPFSIISYLSPARGDSGASDVTRTRDLLITSEMHYRLCYTSRPTYYTEHKGKSQQFFLSVTAVAATD